MSRETKFSGSDGDREKHFPCSAADHEQDWHLYPVDPYSTKSANDPYSTKSTDDAYSVEVITCFHFEGVSWWCVTLRCHRE